MKRLKGPELKMPLVVKDLYWDLYDRRLLPLVALAVVAIAAVPFLLGGGSEESPRPPVGDTAGASALEDAGPATLTVVESKPGLRDYRKRLADRQPTDPFKQRYTHVDLSGAQLNPQTESSSDATSTTTATTVTGGSGGSTESGGGESTLPPAETSPGGASPGGDDGEVKSNLTFYTFAIKVRIAKSGGKEPDSKQEPTVKEKVLPLTPLPGEKAPVVTYMGSSKGKPVFLVSNDVKSVFGDAKCISGDDVCQLLEVEPGLPTTFVYGYNEVHYTINVLKIYPVVTGRS